MKILFTAVLIISFCQLCFSQTWTQKGAVYPGGGGRATTAFAIPSLGSGYTVCGAPYNHQTWQYDTLSDSWAEEQDFPGGADGTMVGFTINDTGYVGTGVSFGCGFYNEFYMYDPVGNQWTQLASVPGSARGYAVGFALNGKGYIGGGITGCGGVGLNDFYCYDPKTGKWDTIAPYPGKGSGQEAVGFAIGNYGYVGTGDSVGSSSVPQKDFWRYDPSNNTWTKMADFGGGVRGGASGFATCDKGYIGLGYNDASQSVVLNDFWQYDPAKNLWTPIANFGGVARQVAPSFVIGKSCFVTLGVAGNNNTQTDIWEYIQSAKTGFIANSSVCAGKAVSFTDTSDYSPTNWSWNFPGGTPDTSTSQNPVITYNTPGNFDVTLTAWNGCDSATKTISNFITVNPAPLKPVFPKDTSFCGNFNLTLNSGTTGFTYVWSTGDTTHNLTVNTLGKYWVSVSNSCDTVVSDTLNITVDTNTVLTVIPQTVSICPGTNVTLKVSGGGSNFVWSPSAGLSATTGDSVVAAPTISATYSVRGNDSIGCPGKDSGIVITVIPAPNKPTITVSVTGDSLISSAGSYNQWNFDGTAINDSTRNILIIKGHIRGYYSVTVTNPANGCTTTSDSTTSINQLLAISDQLSVYPNPFNNYITVKINSSAQHVNEWSLQLTDVLGRTLYTEPSLNYSNEIDLSNLPCGVYFIIVTGNTARAVLPVVKQN